MLTSSSGVNRPKLAKNQLDHAVFDVNDDLSALIENWRVSDGQKQKKVKYFHSFQSEDSRNSKSCAVSVCIVDPYEENRATMNNIDLR